MLAILDTALSGPVPVKVTKYTGLGPFGGDEWAGGRFEVVVTASGYGYPRGLRLEARARDLFPRCYSKRGGSRYTVVYSAPFCLDRMPVVTAGGKVR